MKKTTSGPTIPSLPLDFWKENKIAQHFTLTSEEVSDKFRSWLLTKDQSWIDYYNSERIIRFFITDPDGLNSVFDEGQFDRLFSFMQPIILEKR